MAEYWKSTPSYWCKFCSIYVRDTSGERKNHEATGKHQNNIQRSLRDLHKGQEREQREKQRAKDEVARLNGLVGGSKDSGSSVTPGKPVSRTAPLVLDQAAQRKAHVEQLVALGVALPDHMKREVTGVGGWQVVSERVVDADEGRRNLADIKEEEQDDADSKDGLIKGVRKRKAEEEEDEQLASRRKVWGSTLKSYPGNKKENAGDEDLDALLNGVAKKKEPVVKDETGSEEHAKEGEASDAAIKQEPGDTVVQESTGEDSGSVKQEQDESVITAPPVVVFKKRKGAKR